MRFRYRAVDASGQLCSGYLEAGSLDDLEHRLRRMQLELVSGKGQNPGGLFGERRLPRRDLLHLCFHLEHLLQAGVPLLECLHDLRDSLKPGGLRNTLDHLADGIDNGQSLSQAMQAAPAAFDPVVVNLVLAGEQSGQLPEVFHALGESLKWEDELASHTRKLMLYPLLVGGTVMIATVFLMIHLVPQLKLFVTNMGHALPMHTRLLFSLSAFLIERWPLLLAAPVLFWGIAGLILRRHPQARQWLDSVKLALPIIGAILHKLILSRFASTLAMLYAAGTPLIEALHTSRGLVGNAALRRALLEVEHAIRQGSQIGQAFDAAKLFPPLLVRMLRVGEQTGRLDSALHHVAYFYSRDVREAVAKAQTLIEPALTLLIGLLLGWIMLAVIGPIYDVISRINP